MGLWSSVPCDWPYQGSVKLDLTRNQSITTLYRYDNVTFCNVQFCNNVPFCHVYQFVTVLLSNVSFLAMYSFVMILHFKMYRFVMYSCVTYHFGMNLFAMYHFATYRFASAPWLSSVKDTPKPWLSSVLGNLICIRYIISANS